MSPRLYMLALPPLYSWVIHVACNLLRALACKFIEPITELGIAATLLNETMFVTSFAPVPLPAALPLFATGLGALGLLGWCRKRKAQAAA